jgi:hypothetical protein
MELIDALGDGPVAIDSVVFIYFIEKHPRFLEHLLSLFRQLTAAASWRSPPR